jgi:hypothetical protein
MMNPFRSVPAIVALVSLAGGLVGCDQLLGVDNLKERPASSGSDDASTMPEANTAPDASTVPDANTSLDGTTAPDGILPADATVAPTDGAIACAPDQLVCNGGCLPSDGIQSCGSCANDCTQSVNIVPANLGCSDAGRCLYTCAPGYADCAASGKGCGTYLGVNGNCGGCGVTCSGATPLCSPGAAEGTFQCTSSCPPTAPTPCSGACVDLQTDDNNCGTCGNPCMSPQTCKAGRCGCTPCILDNANLDHCCIQ